MRKGSHFVLKLKKIIGLPCPVKVHKEFFLVLILGNSGQNHKK